MKIIWYKVPETEGAKEKFLTFWAICFSFNPLKTWKIKILTLKKKTPGDITILHICTINDSHMMYGSWDMEHDRQFFVILDHFLPFYPPMDPKNQNFEKMKEAPGDIIILHVCNKNYDQMMYGSWDIVHDRWNCYFSF